MNKGLKKYRVQVGVRQDDGTTRQVIISFFADPVIEFTNQGIAGKAVESANRRWPNHTVYSSGVHYNALGNELIAGAVLAQLGFWKY